MPRFLLVLLLLVSPAVAEEIRIGWIGPLTGNAAVLGRDALVAAQMVVDEVNLSGGIHGDAVRLLVEDDQMIVKQSIASYRKLTEQQGTRIILVYSYSGLFSLAPLARKDGVILIDPLDCDEDIAKLPDNIFCVAKLTEHFGQKLAEDMVQLGAVPAGALYYSSDGFPVKVVSSIKEHLARLGHPLAFEGAYTADERDFRSYYLRARQKGIQSLAILGEFEVGVAVKQAREQNLGVQLYTFSTILSPDTLNVVGAAVNGVRIIDWTAEDSEILTDFLEKFQLRSGRQPAIHVSTVPTYDVMRIVTQALKNAPKCSGSAQAASVVKRALSNTREYKGASGTITIDPDGCTRSLKVSLANIVEMKRLSR